ncbi:MAG: peptidase M23 [Spirochaetae bacterium HGW-Spirochaetae-3]|nr:MAG: peptidase M23 [Spirochaetae bacterium HGW-Spirochaetae-3]
MATLKRYKDLEKSFAKRVGTLFRRFFASTGDKLSRFFRTGRQKITIMLVPHSEKRILNLQISFFGLAAFLIVILGAAGFLTYSSIGYSDVVGKLVGKSDALKTTQADLDSIRDSTARLVKAARSFQAALDSTLSGIGVNGQADASTRADGDLAAFFSPSEIGSGRLREAAEIERVSGYLERSVKPLNELGDTIEAQGGILSEIPNIWPIKGGIGHISMYYGQNENPIYGSWYIHKGIDLSTFRSGDPILATADGKVVTVAYDISLGNYIVIEHKHGFLTRYAHMSAFKVQKGAVVKQGQIIGYIGNTGLSTGPHLHYEVHLGTETIDPLRFLNIRSNSATLTR